MDVGGALDFLKLPYFNQAKGELEELSALDPKFCQAVNFSEYQSAPETSPEMDPSVWENWIENLNLIEKNLIWLLKLQHPKFWCQVVNSASLQICLDSYLKKAPRFQTMCWPDEALEKHNSVHKLVFLTYLRMATYKESSRNFISRDFFGELIYENFIFDVPKIMDLCSVYGNETNSSLLGKAISNVFECQPAYNDDLKQTVDTVLEIFHSIDEKCGLENHAVAEGNTEAHLRRPQRLSESAKDAILLEMPFVDFKDLILYVSDVTHTLSQLLVEVYPKACSSFYRDKNFPVYLAQFYSSTLLRLREAIQERHIDDLHLRSQLLAHLKLTHKSLLSVTRKILNECLLQPALNAADAGDVSRATSLADQYLQVLSDLLAESRFFSDFMRKLPIIDDVQSLLQASPNIDETRASFILGSLGSASSHKADNTTSPRFVNGTDSPPAGLDIAGQRSQNVTSSGAEGASCAPGLEMESLISSVREVLPDLGDGFIESCLLYYDKDCERTIHALLEENLPDDLRIMDRLTPRSRVADLSGAANGGVPLDVPHDGITVLQERKNVFDKDEFDVYENLNVDHTRIHKGKRDKTTLDESLKAPEMRRIYERYSVVCDVEEVSEDGGAFQIQAGMDNMYDDEYDDMYDGLGVDANDADDADDLLNRRPFVTPRVFLQSRRDKTNDQESEESEESGNEKKDHFIANPAEVRAKQEERRRQQQELRGRKHPQKKPQGGPNSDKPNPTRDHKKKDVHKARIGNHNRKKMATKKAAKGMGPA